jgi:hypothetical protein
MLRSSLIAPAGLALLLCACEPQGLKMTETAAPPATPADCAVHVEKAWIDQETPLRRYTSEAATTGPTCEAAVATLVIRAREGSPIYTWAGATRDIFGLKDAADPTAMKTALLDWINQDNSNLRTTDQLPPWEETEGQPKRAEFPFHPETWYDAAAWEALRKEKLDLFCFPQGGESLDCAALRDGQMESIGVQQFPG